MIYGYIEGPGGDRFIPASSLAANFSLKKKQKNNEINPFPDSKVHGANMGPTWGRQDPGGPHVGRMNLAGNCEAQNFIFKICNVQNTVPSLSIVYLDITYMRERNVLGQHWFRLWPVAYSDVSHCLKWNLFIFDKFQKYNI